MAETKERVFGRKIWQIFPICSREAIRGARAIAPHVRHPTLFYATLTIYFIPPANFFTLTHTKLTFTLKLLRLGGSWGV